VNALFEQVSLACTIGASQTHRGLTVFPLIRKRQTERTYLTLPEALGLEGFAIAEVADGATVPHVQIRNPLDKEVLLIDGEELAGAMQNRVINTSVLVPARGETVIPVSCTEAGRWQDTSSGFSDSGWVMPPSIRARKIASVGESLRAKGERRSDQGEVWDTIAHFSARAGTRSATGAMRDVFVGRQQQVAEFQEVFVPCEGQAGLVAGVGGVALGVDLLSSAEAYAVLAPKLVAGYALQAIVGADEGDAPVPAEEVQALLAELRRCEETVFPGVGIGREYRYTGAGGVGTALFSDNQLIHATFQAQSPAVPFARSYWVLPGRLLAGYYPGAPTKEEAAEKLTALLDAGIRCFVNLVEEGEKNEKGESMVPYQQLLAQLASSRKLETSYLRIPIHDQDVPSRPTMRLILDAIDRALGQNQPVYVHCWGGRGRTGTVVGCFLARHGMTTGEKAVERIAYMRRKEQTSAKSSPENEGQRDLVFRWGTGE